MSLSLHSCRRSRGLRIMAVLACLMLVLTSVPVMASGMLMPKAGAATTRAPMQMSSQHMANGQMAACCQGQRGQASMTACHCPVMCGSVLSSVTAVRIASECVAMACAPLTGVQVPSPSPLSPLRPPIA